MAGDTVVVDASAIAAVIFIEPGSENVWSILETRGLIAPSLLPYEITNVALRKIEDYPEQSASINEIIRQVNDMMVDYVQIPMEEMLDLAQQTGLTSYDAAYLWLSLELHVPLMTLDKDLDSAARRLGIQTFELFG